MSTQERNRTRLFDQPTETDRLLGLILVWSLVLTGLVFLAGAIVWWMLSPLWRVVNGPGWWIFTICAFAYPIALVVSVRWLAKRHLFGLRLKDH